VTLASRISRQTSVRIAVAFQFAFAGGCAVVVLTLLDASPEARVALPLLVVLTAVPIAFAPTRTMDERWFQVLPLLITVETGIAMWTILPDPGAIVPMFAFNGAMTVFLIREPRGAAVQLMFASAVMMSPVVAGETTLPSTITIVVTMGVMWGYAVVAHTIWRYAEDAATRLDELAQRDALTGVGNRRALDERLEYELVRHVRSGRPLALIVLDLNGFKAINDDLGHAAGDDALRDVALAITGAVRAQDTVARPGGDEFCVITPDTDADGADILVANIRRAIGRVSVAGRPLRAAIGASVAPRDGQSARQLFEVADSAQRDDKPDGRGRMVLASAG
jgi:diguanylate cyclase (GGDEF)-like protein